jgi:hypothetical protein
MTDTHLEDETFTVRRQKALSLYRLSDNSISGQKHVINKVYKAFKSKKEEIGYYW